jgi:predicted aldo/keto reductase-like oxidoreductase
MRLPQREAGGKKVFDHEESVRIMHRAFELGVNYIDSAPYYCDGESEIIVGKALKGRRDRVKVSTKLPLVGDCTAASVRATLEKSLKNLDTGYIDFYHLWGISWDDYEKKFRGAIHEEMLKAKSEGLIKHLSFSFHDKPASLVSLVDTGCFDSVLCQYNLLDRSNEQAIAYAHEKGLGVNVMGPVAGGRLGAPSPEILGLLPGGTKSSAEIALRFVLSNPSVCCALSGMGTIAMVEENAEIAYRPLALTETEKAQVLASMEEKKKLADLYCTGCRYCMPCPQGVDIPRIFELMNLHRVYGQTAAAKASYARLGKEGDEGSLPVSSCVECGLCEEKCPQEIEIRKRLKETEEALGK